MMRATSPSPLRREGLKDPVILWEGIGFIEIFHVEARRVTSSHLLRGIVVAIETKTVVLSEDSLPVLETPSATCKEFVLAVSLVPIAHLYPI